MLLLAFLSHLVMPPGRYWPGYSLAVVIAIIQLARVYLVLCPRVKDPIRDDKVSPAFGYSSQLAWRRGSPKLEIGTKQTEDTEERTIASEDSWRLEFMDTYRHLREHGNSAFIFTLELALAALASCVVTKPAQSASHQLSAIGVLFAIWAFPSMFIHLLAQHLERRFSRFDQTRNL